MQKKCKKLLINELEPLYMDAAQKENTLSFEDVNQFLKENPDFFIHNAHLLTQLNLPSGDAGTVKNFSVVQSQKLQKKIVKYEERIQMLMRTALQNEKSSEEIHHFILQILESTSLEELKANVCRTLKEDFKLDHVMFVEGETLETLLPITKIVTLKHTHAADALYTPNDAEKTYAEAWLKIEFATKCPAILIMSSGDTQRFYEGKGDSLLTFLAKVIAHAWQKLS